MGFVAALVLNAFVLDEYDAYGEVTIPGSTNLHLPAGELTVSFHTDVHRQADRRISDPGPEFRHQSRLRRVPDPQVTESIGGTTSVNSDVHVRIWTVQIPQEGNYDIQVDGSVNGYIKPQLAFGRDGSRWLGAGLFGWSVRPRPPRAVRLVDLVGAVRKKARPLEPHELVTHPPTWSAGPAPVASYTPTDQGVRLEQIRQLAALRDSGALTEEEYAAEKRRILERLVAGATPHVRERARCCQTLPLTGAMRTLAAGRARLAAPLPVRPPDLAAQLPRATHSS